MIQIGSIGWTTEIVNLNISISNTHLFNFYVEAERKTGDCCSYTEYNEVRNEANEFELDSESGIYKILVE